MSRRCTLLRIKSSFYHIIVPSLILFSTFYILHLWRLSLMTASKHSTFDWYVHCRCSVISSWSHRCWLVIQLLAVSAWITAWIRSDLEQNKLSKYRRRFWAATLSALMHWQIGSMSPRLMNQGCVYKLLNIDIYLTKAAKENLEVAPSLAVKLHHVHRSYSTSAYHTASSLLLCYRYAVSNLTFPNRISLR